jgi:hypothetical protein
LCDLGEGVSVMPFSLYKNLDLDKLVSTEVFVQMVDKSKAIHIGVYENMPLMIANVQILNNFVVL